MAKELFNSSEKSNFILNLTEEKYSKMASVGLLTACFLVSAMTAIPEILHRPVYSLSSAGLAVSGVICLILAIIAFIKKYITGKKLIAVGAFGVFLLLALISSLTSYNDINTGIYGYTGRGEGFLALMFYFSFFVTAISIKTEKALRTLVWGIIGTGILNSLWSLEQVFHGDLGFYRTVTGIKLYAASGLSQSPLFLAMVLTLSLTAAVTGAILMTEKKQRIICTVSACLFSFIMMFTYSLIGICGEAIGIIAAVITVFAKKAPKLRLLNIFTVIVPAIAAVLLVNAGVISTVNKYSLYDGRILWGADSYQRLSASGMYDPDHIDIDNTFEVYYTLNHKTLDLISQRPVLGTGPDQLVFPQLYNFTSWDGTTYADAGDIISTNKGTFDKVYDQYLYTAATTGIPSLIAIAAVLVTVVILGAVQFRRGISWANAALYMVTAAGIIIFFVGVSNITFSPIFWAAAGCSCVELINGKKENKARKHN